MNNIRCLQLPLLKSLTLFDAVQASLLAYGQTWATELVEVQRDWHHKYINQPHPTPCQYAIDNVVFAWRAVKSVKKHGLVGKLMDSFTGPWKVCDKGKRSSYFGTHEHR